MSMRTNVLSLNAPTPISSRPSIRIAAVNPEQPKNAPSPIALTVGGTRFLEETCIRKMPPSRSPRPHREVPHSSTVMSKECPHANHLDGRMDSGVNHTVRDILLTGYTKFAASLSRRAPFRSLAASSVALMLNIGSTNRRPPIEGAGLGIGRWQLFAYGGSVPTITRRSHNFHNGLGYNLRNENSS